MEAVGNAVSNIESVSKLAAHVRTELGKIIVVSHRDDFADAIHGSIRDHRGQWHVARCRSSVRKVAGKLCPPVETVNK